MPLTTSLYLELLRSVAAFAVFLFHISSHNFTGGFAWQLGILGDDAVMAFFVLSGFVICFSAEHKHATFADYMLARLGRLWSVALPAIVLTLVLDFIVQAFFDQTIAANHREGVSLFSGLTSAFFINQIWYIAEIPGSNAPFWSLSYEFAYYVIFALLYYLRGNARILAVAVAVLVAGPKIMLFMPMWMMGAIAYRLTRVAFSQALGWLLFVGSLIALICFYAFGVKPYVHSIFPAGDVLHNGVWSTGALLVRYLFAAIICANIVGFSKIGSAFQRQLALAEPAIKGAARYSFSLYLYHFPILMFLASVSIAIAGPRHPHPMGTWWQISIMYIGSLSCVYVLGRVTEPRKKEVIRAIEWLTSRLYSPASSPSSLK